MAISTNSNTRSCVNKSARGINFEALPDALRRLHPSKTAAHVAAATGLSARTIEHWLSGGRPSALAFAMLIVGLGPEFLAGLMAAPPAWLCQAAANARLTQLQAQRALLEQQIAACGTYSEAR